MNEAETSEPAPIAPAIGAKLPAPARHETVCGVLPECAGHLHSTKAAPALAGNILHGADEIAEFLYGDRKSRRKVYHLVESGQLPVFRLGVNICARRSVLVDWIEAQERRQLVPELPSAE